MPHLYAAAASPMGQAALELASGEGPRTKGPKAVFAVALMFLILCGGVFMLLQSSFGPKLGYLITGTAFWGCWLVLSLLWLTGVPGLPMPFGIPDVPESTVKYTGPQGTDASWELIDSDEERRSHAVPEGDRLFKVNADNNITDQSTQEDVTAAKTAAAEGISAHYGRLASTDPSRILPNSVYVIDDVRVAREGRRVQWVRLTTKAATPNASADEETKALLGKIQPATFDLYFVKGDLAIPTYMSIGVFTLLFGLHVALLGWVDNRQRETPTGVPERLVTA